MNKLTTVFLTVFMAATAAFASPAEEASVSGNYLNNRQPLLQKDYIELPLGAITA